MTFQSAIGKFPDFLCGAGLVLSLVLGGQAGGALAEETKAEMEAEAATYFKAAYLNACQTDDAEMAEKRTPQSFEIKFKYAYEEAATAPHVWGLFQFPCYLAAYNELSVFIIVPDHADASAVHLAAPVFDVDYENGDYDGKVLGVKLTGFSAADEAMNAGFDPETNTITEFSKWRGLGDASSEGTWVFTEGEFILSDYQIDPSYDGEINPLPVIKNGVPVPAVLDYEPAKVK